VGKKTPEIYFGERQLYSYLLKPPDQFKLGHANVNVADLTKHLAVHIPKLLVRQLGAEWHINSQNYRIDSQKRCFSFLNFV
jgi:hypothetical protein